MSPSEGVFVSYYPYQTNLVIANGFSAGMYIDGTQAYVGYGSTFGQCFGEDGMPGRISVANFNRGAGTYMTCDGELFDGETPEYLENSVRLQWVATTTNAATSVPHTISMNSGGSMHYFIGRTMVSLQNGTSFVVVSKVHYDGAFRGMYYFNPVTQTETVANNFDVLTCAPWPMV